MTIPGLCRRAAALAVVIGSALLLAACTVSSEAPLFAASDGDEALGGRFTFMPYKEAEGTFTLDTEGAQDFVFGDGGYASADGNMTAYFIDAGPWHYLLQLTTPDGALYGTARVGAGDIMELRLVLSGDPASEMAAAGVAVPVGATFADGGVIVADVEAARTVVDLIADGVITAPPLLVYTGTGLPPETIVADGDWYKAE